MRAFRWDALPSNGVAPFDLGREQVPSSEVESTDEGIVTVSGQPGANEGVFFLQCMPCFKT